jgi:hypothetical protein
MEYNECARGIKFQRVQRVTTQIFVTGPIGYLLFVQTVWCMPPPPQRAAGWFCKSRLVCEKKSATTRAHTHALANTHTMSGRTHHLPPRERAARCQSCCSGCYSRFLLEILFLWMRESVHARVSGNQSLCLVDWMGWLSRTITTQKRSLVRQ